MENREILIANTKTQKRSKIMSSATTLGELKADMDNAGINYDGMTFTEGISKIQLLDDATQLPKNVMFKGNPTNNLVILLTNTKKNIASGAYTRQDAYAIIRSRGLQDAVKDRFGRNFTQVPTANLIAFIAQQDNSKPMEDAKEVVASPSPAVAEGYDDVDDDDNTYSYNGSDAMSPRIGTLAEAINYIIDFLVSSGSINYNEAMLIADATEKIAKAARPNDLWKDCHSSNNGSLSTSDGITNDDVDDMIDDLM